MELRVGCARRWPQQPASYYYRQVYVSRVISPFAYYAAPFSGKPLDPCGEIGNLLGISIEKGSFAMRLETEGFNLEELDV